MLVWVFSMDFSSQPGWCLSVLCSECGVGGLGCISCTARAARVGWGHHGAAATNFHGLEKLFPVFQGEEGLQEGPVRILMSPSVKPGWNYCLRGFEVL